jgi:hypothetical protein
MDNDKRKWNPEILYEEDAEGLAGNLPFIQVPDGKEMPGIVFMFSSQDTGEFEPGLDGEEVPIVDLELHQYANMAYIKEGLDEETYNKVRHTLGLEPLADAAVKGAAVTNKIRENIGDR